MDIRSFFTQKPKSGDNSKNTSKSKSSKTTSASPSSSSLPKATRHNVEINFNRSNRIKRGASKDTVAKPSSSCPTKKNKASDDGDHHKRTNVKQEIEIDSDATTDDDGDYHKRTNVKQEIEIDSDATTDDAAKSSSSCPAKKNKASGDGDHHKRTNVKQEIETDSDATTDDETLTFPTSSPPKRIHKSDVDGINTEGRVHIETLAQDSPKAFNNNDHVKKKKKAAIDDDFLEMDSESDFEVKSLKKPKKSVKDRKSPKVKRIIDDSEDNSEEDHVIKQEANNKNMPGPKKSNKSRALTTPRKKRAKTDDSSEFEVKSSRKQRASLKKPKIEVTLVDDKDDNDEEEETEYEINGSDDNNKKNSKKSVKSTTPIKPNASRSPRKRSSTKTSSRSSKSKKSKKQPPPPPPKPANPITSYPHTTATPQCLFGYTFVFTGVMPNFSRDMAEEYVKILGGRVTSQVSGKTNYLVCGDRLEDERNVEEGSKYRKAIELGENAVCILRGEVWLYAAAKLLDEMKKEQLSEQGENEKDVNPSTNGVTPSKERDSTTMGKSHDQKSPNSSISDSKPVNNPYVKPTNPYAKRGNYSKIKQSPKQKTSRKETVEQFDTNALWADKYAPKFSNQILGNQGNVGKLSKWLSTWEATFNVVNNRKPNTKAALLSGPPGIGKTTTAVLVAKESGRHVLEMNASDTRSKKSLEIELGDVTGSQVVSFKSSFGKKKTMSHGSQKRCIIMDEVDGMGAGDRSGISELIKMIKVSKVPIICICNDRQSQKIRSLVSHCLDLRYQRPVKTRIAKRAVEIGEVEGMYIEPNAAEAIAESCGNDIRQVLNCLQMWANKRKKSSDQKVDLTYKDLKSRKSVISKDEILRVSMFDATKLIVEGRKGLQNGDRKKEVDSFFKRTDAFFTDYSLMGLNVQQNYLKVMVPTFQRSKAKGDITAELNNLRQLHAATHSMSDYAVAENGVNSGQNWQLLPLCSALVVKSGFHAGGESGGFLSGFPEFAGWLGKNSSRGRKRRLLQELCHHLNFKISGDAVDLRLSYLPIIRQRLMDLILPNNGIKMTEAIQFMDEYGLDRDDVFEKLDEFTLDVKAEKIADLNSKAKGAFTREYNKGAHKSQALVEEQGLTKKKKRKVTTDTVNNEDSDLMEESENDEDVKTLQKLFKKRKSSGKSRKKKSQKR